MNKYCNKCDHIIPNRNITCPKCNADMSFKRICDNCGDVLEENSKYCRNCGQPIDHGIFCPKCGYSISDDDKFCPRCGYPLKEKSSSKHKRIIAVAGIIAVAILVLIAVLSLMPAEETFEPQTVEVGLINFQIPGDYRIDPSGINSYAKFSSHITSKVWTKSNGDSIYISTMTVPDGVDAQSMVKANGGVQKTIMNEHGYYVEDDGMYVFSFEVEDKVCVISVTDSSAFDEIACL